MISFFTWIIMYSHINMHVKGKTNAMAFNSQTLFGRKFVLLPSQAFQSIPLVKLDRLTISPLWSPVVRVKLKSNWYSGSFTYLHGDDAVTMLKWPRSSPSANLTTALCVTSDTDIYVTVFYNISKTTLAAVRVIPVEWADSFYVFPVPKLRFYAVAALKEKTDVRIYLKNSNNTAGTKTESLDRFEFYFSSPSASQPQFLVASKPVLVYCGYSASAAPGFSSNSDPYQAFYNEYLLPVNQWSKTFICVGLPGTVTVTSPAPNTSVNILPCSKITTGKHVKLINEAGGFIQVKVTLDCPVLVSSKDSIHVTQLITPGALINFHALFSVVPEEKFLSSYTFSGNSSVAPISLFVIIKTSSLSGLNFLGGTITNRDFSHHMGVSNYGIYVFNSSHSGRTTVHHANGEKFGLYMLATTGSTALKTWSFSDIGYSKNSKFCLKNIPIPQAGDMIDNDCDNRTDEETGRWTDLDEDGNQGEDLASPGAVHGQWGAWYPWICSSTCDLSEVRRRLRFCDSPAPSGGGKRCSELNYELGSHCIADNHTCILECPTGTWGSNCSMTCPEHCLEKECDVETGACEEGSCAEGYRGDFCNISCARNTYGIGCLRFCTRVCGDTNCDRFTGECEKEPVSVKTLVVVIPIYIAVALAIIMAVPKLRNLTTPKYLIERLGKRSEMLERQNRNLMGDARQSDGDSQNKEATLATTTTEDTDEETIQTAIGKYFTFGGSATATNKKALLRIDDQTAESKGPSTPQYFERDKESTAKLMSDASSFQGQSE